MREQFISEKEVVVLKELGFNERILIEYDTAEMGTYYSTGRIDDADFDYQIKILYQQAFEWFEKNQSIYVDRLVETTPNEILNITYRLKSFRFPPIEVEFDELYGSFDRDKANLICLRKLIEIIKEK